MVEQRNRPRPWHDPTAGTLKASATERAAACEPALAWRQRGTMPAAGSSQREFELHRRAVARFAVDA